jgi:hypothetical protein
MVRNKGGGVVSPPPNPQAGRLPPVGCPRLLIQYIRSYPPYLEAVSSIRNLRTRQAVVKGDTFNVEIRKHVYLKASYFTAPLYNSLPDPVHYTSHVEEPQ